MGKSFLSDSDGYTEKSMSRYGSSQSSVEHGHQKPLPKIPKTAVWSSLRWWLAEISALLLSSLALLAIIVTVRHYQGQGLQHIKLPSGLTLNGLVALLSTLARATLMVPVASVLSQEMWLWLSDTRRKSTDQAQLRDLELSDAASRGAWGSLLFLRHFRRSWLAHMAALITALSLLFGTATQQFITIRYFVVNDGLFSPGNIPWSAMWNGSTGALAGDELSVPLNLKAAAYNGILTPNVPPVKASCPTNNCTWPITPSLAICGGCVKSSFEISCTNSAASNMTTNGDGVITENFSEPTCVYDMPSGVQGNLTNFANSDVGVGLQVFKSPGATYNSSEHDKFYLSNFEIVGAPYSIHDGGSWKFNDTVAAECALWMCVQAFDIWTINANQSQVVVQEFSTVENSNFTEMLDAAHKNVSLINFTFSDLPQDMNPVSGIKYSVPGSVFLGMKTFFSNLFNGSIFLNHGTQTPTSDIVQAIWSASVDLDPWIQNVAGSMTNVIRSNAPGQLSLYKGTAYQLEYDARWPWLILPIVLVVMSFAILVVIIIKTMRSPVQTWKGSPLVLLFLNVEDKMRVRAEGKMNELAGIEKSIGKRAVELKKDALGNWGLKAA